LLSNAIKYTQNGFVKITVSEADNEVIFAIKDSGVGIDED